jgi:predicted ATPase/signal transduction histidine kinase
MQPDLKPDLKTVVSLPGYDLTEELYRGMKTLVYRGVKRDQNGGGAGEPVVIKFLQRDYPTFQELLQFRNQYTIAANLNMAGIVRPKSLEIYGNSYALVMEDVGGISLKTLMQSRSLGVHEVISIAIQLTEILYDFSRNRIIHKDIKPANILICPNNQQVKVIDFSLASLLPRETEDIKHPNGLEGTLTHLAPEQTGRMNRGIDYRTDFYGLGVTLFELLTGRLPFQSDDPLELVHCHIAKQAPFVCDLKPDIPTPLGKIVAKLMAKNAEDRYQSALGLKHDLEVCQQQLALVGAIPDFTIAQHDVSDRFVIPEKLYGREYEVHELLASFDRVAFGSSELMLVAGFSGIGKTAVVNEVHKPITRQRGYFIKGKFDQFNRNIPLFAFVQAFRNLMLQLIGESDAQLRYWRQEILQALGDNGQILIDVIPELEHIIGPQPPAIELSGTAAQNRFNLLFQKFIQVFATQSHPLVIFLDDLQWADMTSLGLIQLLMTESTVRYLLLIGAYRDNEVFGAHPLIVTLDAIERAGSTLNSITLQPLDRASLNQLVADTLKCSSIIASPLTQLVLQKTQGNPFFVTQFLKALHQDQAITFDPQAGYWQCDLAGVRSAALTDDVVEFMALRLQKLPVPTQVALQLAACVGNQFDLQTLSIISEQSAPDAADALWAALQEELLLPQSEVYKFYLGDTPSSSQSSEVAVYRFLHDRIQQAAYDSIPASERAITHLKIGRLLLQKTPESHLKDFIFDIVNQLNQGVELITDPEERQRLAELNLMAGQKAKAATAYADAVRYLDRALSLLGQNQWQAAYSLTLAIHLEAAEAEYLNRNFERLNALAAIVLKQAQTLLDCISIYELQIQANQAQSLMVQAIETGLIALDRLDIQLTASHDSLALPTLPTIADLDQLPEMHDPRQIAALRILMALYPSIYIARPELMQPLILTMVRLAQEGGYSGLAAYGYVLYGMILCAMPGHIEQGYQAGQLALQLLDRFHATELKAKIYNLFNAHIRFWKEPLKITLPDYVEGCQSGLEVGDLEWASYNAMHYCKTLFWVGEPLDLITKKQSPYLDLLQKNNHEFALSYARIWSQMASNLQGEAFDPQQLISDHFNEIHLIPLWETSKNYMSLFAVYLAKATLFYLFKNHTEAWRYLQLAEPHQQASTGLLVVAIYYFYASLTLLALYDRVDPAQQATYLAIVDRNQSLLQQWAQLAPENFQHKYDLVATERSRVLGDWLAAMEGYDRAIQGARANGYLQEEAIANELAAEFYLSMGREMLVKPYMTEAYYCYSRWGAIAKVKALISHYAAFLPAYAKHPASTLSGSGSLGTGSSISGNLDFISLLNASQTITQTLDLEELLHRSLQIILQNAGAQRGALIMLTSSDAPTSSTQPFQGDYAIVAIAPDLPSSPGAGDRNRINAAHPLPLADLAEDNAIACLGIVNYTLRTSESVIIDRAERDVQFGSHPYVQRYQPQSILCIPLVTQGQVLGAIYLENNATEGAFNDERVEILTLLSAQVAISLENASLYHSMETKVEARTQDLQQALEALQTTQSQLIQMEKMLSLGKLVAGIAHELNNPITFIQVNSKYLQQVIQDLLELHDLYARIYPNPNGEIDHYLKQIDLDFIRQDTPAMFSSVLRGTQRIADIVQSLRQFSQLDEEGYKEYNLSSGIEQTLMLLNHQLVHHNIDVLQVIEPLPLIQCQGAQINQVLMHLLTNAIDAIVASNNPIRRITISAIALDGNQQIQLQISDTGSGIPANIQDKIFDPFFTTKPVGQGTGMGLAICYQIIKQHQGELALTSTTTSGSQFTVTLPIAGDRAVPPAQSHTLGVTVTRS